MVFSLLRALLHIRVIVVARKIHSFRYKNTAPIMACIFQGITREKRGFRLLSLRGIEYNRQTQHLMDNFCINRYIIFH